MFSIYSTAFNVIKNNFAYKEAVINFCSFAEEVVISINESEDSTWEAFEKLSSEYDNLKIIKANVSYEDARLDGKLFDIALQETTKEFKILLGLDQRIPLYQYSEWERLAYEMRFSGFDAYMIPILDLWGTESKVRWDKDNNINFMWALHKRGLRRGVVNFAKLENGKYDPSKSDSNELIYEGGELAKSKQYLTGQCQTLESYLETLKIQNVFLYHMGYVNFKNRVKVNKDIWQKQWEEIRPIEKKENQVPVTEKELEMYETFEHKLKLWYE